MLQSTHIFGSPKKINQFKNQIDKFFKLKNHLMTNSKNSLIKKLFVLKRLFDLIINFKLPKNLHDFAKKF
ncbi:hypothetical protein BpHYR1_029810 [Brachionus plicatilis]|uniref:Uncharacterized protein n=1 Tax=Brachionus plicatilis TaxID=10195 RepID=A0A3M7SF25_BRAPC|nr:hypothetical protein BpHYR1_029810 [Brachionus plicatilis]